MALQLSTELREFIDQEIRAGHYPSEGAAIADALLRLKEEREYHVWLKAEVRKGLHSIDRGKVSEWDLEDTKRRLVERLRAAGKDV